MEQIKKNWKKWLYWFTLGIAIVIVYKALDNFDIIINSIGKFLNVIGPFLAGIFIAYLLYMPCRKIEQDFKKSKNRLIKKKARTFSIFTVYLIVIILLIIFINFILPVISESISDFIQSIPIYYENSIRNYNKLPEDSILKSDIVKQQIENIQNIDLKQYISLDKIIEYIAGAINAVTGIFDIFVALIVSIYILRERDKILRFFKRLASVLFKEKLYKNIGKLFNNSNEVFFKFIASQFLDAIIVGILVTIALSIMKVKYAPLLGFFIGIFNMIPYFGAIIAVAIAALITLVTGGISQSIWMLIVVIILQQIDANIINPKIVGQSLKISPLLVIFAVTVGGAYFGLLGMFLSVPIIAVIRIVVNDYINLKMLTKRKKLRIN